MGNVAVSVFLCDMYQNLTEEKCKKKIWIFVAFMLTDYLFVSFIGDPTYQNMKNMDSFIFPFDYSACTSCKHVIYILQ